MKNLSIWCAVPFLAILILTLMNMRIIKMENMADSLKKIKAEQYADQHGKALDKLEHSGEVPGE